MRAIQVDGFGGPEVLRPVELPEPEPGAGQVLVEVAAADTLFVETVIRSGHGGDAFPVRPPFVPGHGVAGTVVAVGAGVARGWVGRRVAARTPGGGYAQRVAADVAALVPVPDRLGLPEAAALLHDGATALGLFDAARVRAAEEVLVLPAGGGAGVLLVQLAHGAGARVTGAARGAAKLERVRGLGADAVADYSEAGWDDKLRASTGGRGFDVVFDGVGGEAGAASLALAADGARFLGYGMPGGGFTAADSDDVRRRGIEVHGIGVVQFDPEDAVRYIARALEAAAEGRLRPVVGRTFPLDRAAEAHAAIEGRQVTGKTLLLA
ncbi:zinc-binding dehydrogenase [Allonocardiopsis opalescens]|uniref:NADPH2:quinone reductase n=1 Tax=Allonocardiopsis opalescens TaxID=1144618 RepID=A0A2T0Q541_9ACTN|nr:zinc-binding dehydrogenase [Allonocardiopsis opalescens]PRX98893.1 NADPH2:quinone reductase [Allonocardiopsis opalescens]